VGGEPEEIFLITKLRKGGSNITAGVRESSQAGRPKMIQRGEEPLSGRGNARKIGSSLENEGQFGVRWPEELGL